MTARGRLLVQLGLWVVVGAATAAVALRVARQDEAQQARRAEGEKLFRFAPGDVQAVTVAARGETTAVARQGDGWVVTAPAPVGPADGGAVEALLSRMADLTRKGPVAAHADAALRQRDGLDRPRARVEVTLRDGRRETLALGDENPFDGTIFAESTAGAVDLVGPEARWGFERGAAELRARPPPPPAPAPPAAGAPAPPPAPPVAPPK